MCVGQSRVRGQRDLLSQLRAGLPPTRFPALLFSTERPFVP